MIIKLNSPSYQIRLFYLDWHYIRRKLNLLLYNGKELLLIWRLW